MCYIGMETLQIFTHWDIVINNKISVTKIRLHHHDQPIKGHLHHSSTVSGQQIKENCYKLLESTPKRVTKFLPYWYGISFIELLNSLYYWAYLTLNFAACVAQNKPSTMLSSNVKSTDLPMD